MSDATGPAIRRVAPDGTVTTLAGLTGVSDVTDGRGGAARFFNLGNLTVDMNGNVITGGGRIARTSPQGVVTTISTQDATAVAVDRAGNIFAGRNSNGGGYAIVRITPAGVTTTLAGTATAGYITDVAVSRATGDLFYTSANTLYRRTPAGVVTVIPGPATFVEVEPAGTLVTAVFYQVARVTLNGTRTVIAGYGPPSGGLVDGPGTQATFSSITGIAVTSAGVIYLSESGMGEDVRRIDTSNMVSTVAGGAPERGAVAGPLASARFGHLAHIARDSSGNLYVSDTDDFSVRKIATDGTVSTLAGGNGSGTDDGPPSFARFQSPGGLAVDAAGNVFVADTGAHAIRMITPAGDVTTLAGLKGTSGAADGNGTAARFKSPRDIVIDPAGTLYVTDRGNSAIRNSAARPVRRRSSRRPPSGNRCSRPTWPISSSCSCGPKDRPACGTRR